MESVADLSATVGDLTQSSQRMEERQREFLEILRQIAG